MKKIREPVRTPVGLLESLAGLHIATLLQLMRQG